MNVLGQLRESSERAVTSGRSRIDALRRERQKRTLLCELGTLCYAHRSGQGDDETSVEMDRIVAEIGKLEDRAMNADDLGPLATSSAAR